VFRAVDEDVAVGAGPGERVHPRRIQGACSSWIPDFAQNDGETYSSPRDREFTLEDVVSRVCETEGGDGDSVAAEAVRYEGERRRERQRLKWGATSVRAKE